MRGVFYHKRFGNSDDPLSLLPSRVPESARRPLLAVQPAVRSVQKIKISHCFQCFSCQKKVLRIMQPLRMETIRCHKAKHHYPNRVSIAIQSKAVGFIGSKSRVEAIRCTRLIQPGAARLFRPECHIAGEAYAAVPACCYRTGARMCCDLPRSMAACGVWSSY